jgi:dipeptidyl aminopeptidase/acylaminoacyl peptidase
MVDLTAQRDLRNSAAYHQAQRLFTCFRQPGTGQISDASELHASPRGDKAVFSGALMDKLEGAPRTRIVEVDLGHGRTRVLTFGPEVDRCPRFSPDGRQIAFLSDRQSAGDFQLYLLDPVSGAAAPTPPVEGWVEYLQWSPDGTRILLGVAGHGADVAGGQGAVTSKRSSANVATWMPSVSVGDESSGWRSIWIYDLSSNTVWEINTAAVNVWEATWCGNEAIAAVVSPGPSEGLWYTARLSLMPLTGGCRDLYLPKDQLGWPSGSPGGQWLAVVEALCSDRWIVAGDVRLIDVGSGQVNKIETRGVDITYTEWRSDRSLLLAGHRGFETVICRYDVVAQTTTELWSGRELTCSGRYAAVSGFNESGDCALVTESFNRPPEVAVIRDGKYQSVTTFLHNARAETHSCAAAETVTWTAHDGLEIEGWILRPKGAGPYPLVMYVHGGPVGHWRPFWLGRQPIVLMLLGQGYAIFLPNPRGSVGRGQEFIRHVQGDMGGADAQDLLTGLDALVDRGIADRGRIGVMGVSYGGFMTDWIITQDPRFSAAVAVAPISNYVTEHLISNIPYFVAHFLQDAYTNPGGSYFQRSPIMYAHNVRTPTLNICGALDRCTPPEEAVQFHNALLENRVYSVLITYPHEGHGVRTFPAVIDYSARVATWFERFMPSTSPTFAS